MRLLLKFLIPFCILLPWQGRVMAQELSQIEISDNISRVNFSFQGVYYSFEKKLAPVISLYSDLGMGLSYGRMSTIDYHLAVSPTIATEGRWYFTYRRRYNNGKKTLLNSAEFLSLQAAYVFKSIAAKGTNDAPASFFLMANLGLQRTWGKHISFELKFGYGIGYIFENSSFGQGGNLNLKLGYVFNKAH